MKEMTTGRQRQATRTGVILVVASLFWLLPIHSPVEATTLSVSVIVNPDQAISLSREQVLNIFLGNSRVLPDGSRIKPLVLSGQSADHAVFSQRILRRSIRQYRSYWARQLFTGRGKPPTEVSSKEQMHALIKSNTGYIGYVMDGERYTDVFSAFSSR